ncbi:DUF3180 domain-containing protein [Leucobacter sp. GX24907]
MNRTDLASTVSSPSHVSPLVLAAATALAAAAGVLLQVARSSRGYAPLIPPLTLPATLVLFALAVLVLGLMLRRAVRRETGGNVNPSTAVLILAAARASLFVGVVFGGFGAGLALSLLGRSVPAAVGTWLPMVLVLGAGLVLAVCGVIAERCCRIPPPEDGEGEAEEGPEADPDTGIATA